MRAQHALCTNGACKCDACGMSIDAPDDRKFVVHACPATTRHGLGDRVASALSAVGVTEARVASVAATVGIKDCGCRRRREALNRIGRRLGIG